MSLSAKPDWRRLDALVRHDPGGRGVAPFQHLGRPLADGHLEAAAGSLAEHATAVCIVTGFAIANQETTAAETDGPPGDRMTHLISIERVGPSHTLESLAEQTRVGAAPWDEFERDVPREHRDRCHNMRGAVIDACTAPIHRLFEAVAASRPDVKTIGIADGGNEIGMGGVAWELLRKAIAIGPAGQVACRVATDYLILAGVSNWGAYALAVSVAVLRNRADLIATWNADSQRRLIESLVRDAGAVDGVTGLNQAAVDGLPLERYLRTLTAICSPAR